MNIEKSFLASFLIIFSLVFSNKADAATDFLKFPDLSVGQTSSFVKELQKVLNNNGFTITNVGVGSLGQESTYFGGLTRKALVSFQTKNNLLPATGNFGIKTKTAIAAFLKSGKFKGISTGTPVAYGGDTCSFVTDHGITWYFQSAVSCGQFANGEWWVIGPVVVSNIDPNPTQPTPGGSTTYTLNGVTSTVNAQVVTGANGSMINPVLGTAQGFDPRLTAQYQPADLDYDASKNVALHFPINLKVNDVLVSARSDKGYPPSLTLNWNYLKTIAALTVLPTVPPAGSFRPSIWGTDRTIRYNVSQINWGVLNNFSAPASTPSKADIDAEMVALPWFEKSGNWIGNLLQPIDNTADHGYMYGRAITVKFGEVALWLNTNQSLADKQSIGIKMIQNGLDIYEYVKNSPSAQQAFYHDGGHKAGRKLPVVMAAAMLNDASLKTMAARDDIFQEDTQTWYIGQNDVGRALDAGNQQYTQADATAQMPEWGIRHKWEPNQDDRRFHPPYDYRNVVFPAMIGPVLAAELMGLKTAWNHNALFDYTQRYRSEIGGEGLGFVHDMYAFKAGGGAVTAPTTATLTVTKTGAGTVTATGINCGSDCSEQYTIANNTSVVLTATPDAGSVFNGWSGGGCSGTGTCTVTMNANTSVTATFATPVVPFAPGARITVTNSGSPNVNVRNDTVIDPSTLVGTQNNGNAGTIVCGPVTAGGTTWWNVDFDNGADGWSGQNNLTVTSAGTYTGPITCSGTTVTPPTVTTFTLSASKTGTGTGYINGIDAVSTVYNSGTSVTLRAEASSTSTFTGWSGACTGTSLTCAILMNADKNIVASYTLNTATPPALVSPTILYPTNESIISATTSLRVTWSNTGSAYLTRIQDQTPTPGTIIQNNNQTNTSELFTVIPGHTYKFWVHSGTLSNYSTPQADSMFIVASSSAAVPVTDGDGDGVPDSIDKCLDTPHALIAKVNNYGCPIPVATSVKINNDVTSTDITNISNLEIEDKNAVYGKIKFSQPINIYGTGDKKSQINLDSYVVIQNKKVSIDSANAPQLNRPATITLYNVNLTKPLIKKNGEVYATSSSPLMSYDPVAKTLTFTVTGFSTYDVIEDVSIYTLTASKSGTGTGYINGIDKATTTYPDGTAVTLIAVADAGSAFSGWGGDCAGNGSCLVVLNANRSINADFTLNAVASGGGTSSGGGGSVSSGGGGGGGSPVVGGYANPNNTGLGTVQTTAVPKYNLTTDVPLYAKSNDIIQLQKFLNSNGYTVAVKGAGSPGLESNYFGLATKAALIKFQAANKIPTTGTIDLATRTLINKLGGTATATVTVPVVHTNTTGKYTFTKNLTVNSRDAEVIKLQQFLNAKGYMIATKGAGSPGLESNYFGPATRAALARFQKDNGISPAVGYFGALTKAALNK